MRLFLINIFFKFLAWTLETLHKNEKIMKKCTSTNTHNIEF